MGLGNTNQGFSGGGGGGGGSATNGTSGTSGVSGLSASPYVVNARLGTNQTITAGSDQVVNFTTNFDPQSWFASNKFTPTIAGYYNISYAVLWQTGTGTNQLNTQINKNGTTQILINQNVVNTTQPLGQGDSVIVYLNGTTDYIQITAYTASASGSQVIASGAGTQFNATLLTVGNGTNGTSGESGNGTGGTSGTSSNGTSGTSGLTGSSGTSASSGTVGTSGTSASSGTSAANGTAGTNGTSGRSGTSGQDGTSGSSGTSGQTGSSGTSGLTGTAGTSGLTGTAGTSGLTGTSGTSASSGTSGMGTSGTSGSSATSGLTGTAGTSGETGTSGTSGATGTSGSSGTSGQDGSSGLTGSSGTSGTAATSGLTGSSGTAGTSGTSGETGTSGTAGETGTSGTSSAFLGTSGNSFVNSFDLYYQTLQSEPAYYLGYSDSASACAHSTYLDLTVYSTDTTLGLGSIIYVDSNLDGFDYTFDNTQYYFLSGTTQYIQLESNGSAGIGGSATITNIGSCVGSCGSVGTFTLNSGTGSQTNTSTSEQINSSTSSGTTIYTGTITTSTSSCVINLLAFAGTGGSTTQATCDITGPSGPYSLATTLVGPSGGQTNTVSATITAPGTYTVTLRGIFNASPNPPTSSNYVKLYF